MKSISHYFEGRLIRFAIVVFWLLFWFLNVIDKFINKPAFLWAGKDRVTQLVEYFSSIGIENINIVLASLVFISIAEITVTLFLAFSLWNLLKKNGERAKLWFFWGTLTGLGIFTFFAVGDQVFGERSELLEHTIFWVALFISWRAYTHSLKKEWGTAPISYPRLNLV